MTYDDPTDLDRPALRRAAIILSLIVWGTEILYLEVRMRILFSGEDIDYLRILTFRAVWVLTGLAIGAAVYLFVERIRHKPFWQVAAVMAGLTIILGIFHSIASRELLDFLFDEDSAPLSVFVVTTFWLHFQLAWAALILALMYSFRVRAVHRQRTRAQRKAQLAEMQALRYQVNPHFLFNTLNSVAALVLDKQPGEAERMIRRLSEFLRTGLSADPLEDVALADEVAQQMVYLEVEAARFPERLKIRTDIESELGQALVPSFILQPLVENAVKYGVARSSGLTTVTISARESEGHVILSVQDDGSCKDIPSGGTGTGLRNVRQRLEARYGEDYTMRSGPVPGGGYRVEIELPAEGDE